MFYKTNILIYSLLVVVQSCIPSKDNEQKTLELKIVNSKIVVSKRKPNAVVTVYVRNNSVINLLMYNFMTAEGDYLSLLDDYMGGNCTSGMSFFILDEKDKGITPLDMFVDDILGPPITIDTLRNVLNRISESFVRNTLLVHSHSEIKIDIELDFSDFELNKGEYKLFLLYYSGKNLYNVVPEKTVKSDEKKYNAKEFRGWIKSNTVKLIVE